jgi:hypothetical protein
MYIFPASTSNQITYNYFCTLNGLENPNVCKIMRQNGTYIYFTYHLLTVI